MVLKSLNISVSLWEGVVVLKGLMLDHFHFGRVWWSCEDSFLSSAVAAFITIAQVFVCLWVHVPY